MAKKDVRSIVRMPPHRLQFLIIYVCNENIPPVKILDVEIIVPACSVLFALCSGEVRFAIAHTVFAHQGASSHETIFSRNIR